ncbi:MAG: lactate utilization protein [Desulfobacteraceae bacterium]|nr:lactate utilization protein [Desulfobacteraceae bacterium]
MKVTTEQYRRVAAREMADEYTQGFLKLLPARLAERRKTAFADFADPAAARAAGAAIRAGALENLPQLLTDFEKNAKAAGARVFWARDAAAANKYIVDTARENGISGVTKGKSMITEELGLNQALAENGIHAWETDLGEFITQLLACPPFHIVGPALNIPVGRISEIFLEKGLIAEPEHDPVQLGLAARRFLREKFRHLEMGITGVNLAAADSGTLINVENEGNIRLSKSRPRIQVAVMSLEKVVADMPDAMHLIRLLCRSCTGQQVSAYVSMDTGPKKNDEIDGPEQLHIVILDNGRTRIYENPVTRQALRCIRCGACLNACPVYGQIGGYPYGWAYSGPMGQVLSPLLLGFARTRDLFSACTLCGKCRDVCPAGIDHPELMRYYRHKDAAGDPDFRGTGAPRLEKAVYGAYAIIAGNPALWRVFGAMARRAVNCYARGNTIGKGPGVLKGWFAFRDLPAPPDRSFRDQWKRRSPAPHSAKPASGRKKP